MGSIYFHGKIIISTISKVDFSRISELYLILNLLSLSLNGSITAAFELMIYQMIHWYVPEGSEYIAQLRHCLYSDERIHKHPFSKEWLPVHDTEAV